MTMVVLATAGPRLCGASPARSQNAGARGRAASVLALPEPGLDPTPEIGVRARARVHWRVPLGVRARV